MIAVLLAAALFAIGSAPPPAACVTVSLAVVVDLDDARHAHLIAHERAAVDAGQPRILHLDRQDADAHRAASLKGIPTWSELSVARRKQIDPDHWQLQHDRDEYSPALSAEGGAGADVRYVLSSENRSGGALMGRQLAPFCDSQSFVIEADVR